MFGKFTDRFIARKAYSLHVQGNQLVEKREIEKGTEKHLKALELYQKAYDAGYRDPNILMAYAVLLMRFDKCEQARDLLLLSEQVGGMDQKEKKQLRINFAINQWKLGDLDKAIENLEIAGSNGMTSMIYTALGFFYIEKGKQSGDYSKAEEFNTSALEYDDEDAGILDNIGQLYYAKGDTDKAYEFFSKAFNVKPSQVATLYYIAKINYERGNFEKALAFINECIKGNFSALATITRDQAEELRNHILEKTA